jgi:hypothetical protein
MRSLCVATEDKTCFTPLHRMMHFFMNTGEGPVVLLGHPSSLSDPSWRSVVLLGAVSKAAVVSQHWRELCPVYSASECLRNTTFYSREVW